MLSFLEKYRKQIIISCVFVLALLIRTYLFGSHPGGLNQDEASIGYDAWALLNYGVDRNGVSMPVHLLAWGSGQNALYAYLSMPFIKLFGLNVVTVRMVNLIFGMVAVAVVYFMVKQFRGYRTALIAAALTAIAPWHIMLSRWGLESNIFPAMLLLSVWTFLKAFDNKYFLILSGLLFALTLYSYGSAYPVVTLFCLFAFVYTIVKKAVPAKILIISAAVFIIFALPIYLFVIVNMFGLESINIGFISIPALSYSRIVSLSGFSLSGAFKNIFDNLILQVDSSTRNSFPVYGCFYVISLPFFIAGVIKSFKEKTAFDFALLLMFACSFLLFFIYSSTNINRVNALYLPAIIFTAAGIESATKKPRAALAVGLSYCIMFCGFAAHYFGSSYRAEISREFFDSFDSAIMKAKEVSGEEDTIFVTGRVNMPYIYVLFYTQTPPQEYISTVKIRNPNAEFQKVESFGNYVFNLDGLNSRVPGIYIARNNEIDSPDYYTDEYYVFENYTVLVI